MSYENAFGGNAIDPRQLASLRGAAGGAPSAETAREVARQFEALFVQNMMKSMRDATPGDALFGSNATDQYQSLFDQQIAGDIASGSGLGLAPLIERQILSQQGLKPASDGELDRSIADYPRVPGTVARAPASTSPAPASPSAATSITTPPAVSTPSPAGGWSKPSEFVRDIWPAAERTAAALGVPARALVAQAALETGWGRHVLRHEDGRSSNNLFNIKAHRDWDADSVRVSTLEYRAGSAVREVADFRSYADLDEAFRDYAAFLRGNPRYREALAAGGDATEFVRALQDAGYATDPRYAEKLERILDGHVLRAASVKNSAERTTT